MLVALHTGSAIPSRCQANTTDGDQESKQGRELSEKRDYLQLGALLRTPVTDSLISPFFFFLNWPTEAFNPSRIRNPHDKWIEDYRFFHWQRAHHNTKVLNCGVVFKVKDGLFSAPRKQNKTTPPPLRLKTKQRKSVEIACEGSTRHQIDPQNPKRLETLRKESFFWKVMSSWWLKSNPQHIVKLFVRDENYPPVKT